MASQHRRGGVAQCRRDHQHHIELGQSRLRYHNPGACACGPHLQRQAWRLVGGDVCRCRTGCDAAERTVHTAAGQRDRHRHHPLGRQHRRWWSHGAGFRPCGGRARHRCQQHRRDRGYPVRGRGLSRHHPLRRRHPLLRVARRRPCRQPQRLEHTGTGHLPWRSLLRRSRPDQSDHRREQAGSRPDQQGTGRG